MPSQPKEDSAAYRLLNDDVWDDVTPTSNEFIKQAIAEKAKTHFDEENKKMVADQRGIYHRLSPEEREEIEREIEEQGIGSLCRCTQADFKDPDISVRHRKAVMVNLYFEYGGNWAKVFKDNRSVSRRAMAVYWRDEVFKAYIVALDPILMLEARGVVVEVWKDGLDEKARLAAALRFLEQADAYNWDRGVRRQVIANKGSLQSALFNKVISDEEFLQTYIKDKLNKLPENVREALETTLVDRPAALPPPTLEPAWSPPQTIQTMDMNRLKDPFGQYDETKENEE